MKKEEFLIEALRKWCHNLEVGCAHEDMNEDEESMDSISGIERGFEFIDAAQKAIDMKYVWSGQSIRC